MATTNSVTITKTKTIDCGEVLTVSSSVPGKFDVSIIFNRSIDGKLTQKTASQFTYASITPYFDIIVDEMTEVGNAIDNLRKNPFDNKSLEKLNNAAIINKPPFKTKIKLNFTEDMLESDVIWFCCADNVAPGDKVLLAAIDFDLSEGDDWIVENAGEA